MIDAAHLKAHRTAASLVPKGLLQLHRAHQRWAVFQTARGLRRSASRAVAQRRTNERPQGRAAVAAASQQIDRRSRIRQQLAPCRALFSLGELNAAIVELIDELNARPMRRIGSSRRALFEAIERPALQLLPAEPFECAEWKRCRAGLDYHIEVHGHWYFVPYRAYRPQSVPDVPPIQHGNIRGGGYYH